MAGYISIYISIVPVMLMIVLLWYTFRRFVNFDAISVLFTLFIVLAALAIIANAPVMLMVFASVMALAAWDLSDFKQEKLGDSQVSDHYDLEKNHLRSLYLVVVVGLVISLAGSYFNFILPFGVLLVLVIFAFTGVIIAVNSTIKKPR